MTFKFVSTECKIVRRILGAHGFKEVCMSQSSCILMYLACIYINSTRGISLQS